MKKTMLSVVGGFLLIMGLTQAHADVIGIGTGQVGTPFGINGSNTGWTPVTINGGPASGGGIPLIRFSTTANNQLISVSFTANCQISSSINTYIYVRFTVDGASMLPKQFPLCSGRGTTFGIGNDISTVQAFLNIPYAGWHDFRVEAKVATSSLYPVNNGYGYIRDTTTIIHN